jgi:hypothetical protein
MSLKLVRTTKSSAAFLAARNFTAEYAVTNPLFYARSPGPSTSSTQEKVMTHTDFGTTGAKRASIEDYNPLALLQSIKDKHPKATESRLLTLFTEEVMDGQTPNPMLEVVIGYTFANLMKRMRERRPLQETEASVNRRAAMASQARAGLQQHIEKKAEELLMKMKMPNGKALEDCRFSYTSKLGGFLAGISEGQNPRKTVGQVYTEEQLREMRKAGASK